MKATGSMALRIGMLLLSAALDLALLRPLLTDATLAPHQTRRAYYEPLPDGTALMLDEQHDGYMTDLQIDAGGNLAIPAGRTIAIPLQRGSELIVRTLAADLAPYIVLGSEVNTGSSGAPRLENAVVFDGRTATLEPAPWNLLRPWNEDKGWLRRLHAQCDVGPQPEVSIRTDRDEISIRIGSCTGKVQVASGASNGPLLIVVAGLHAAVVSRSGSAWRQIYEVHWQAIVVVLLRVAILGFALGAGPTALASGVLFVLGQFWPLPAILSWGATLPLAVAAAAIRLVARVAPGRAGVASATGAVVLAVEIGGIVAAIVLLDIGTFGHERTTREGDSSCSVVGYSTVRGDSLREGSAGVVERLDESCARCRSRTSRFSREAQTLRWIRQVVCSPSFPSPAGGEVVFLGGGNDDMFYRPTGLMEQLRGFAGTLRYTVQPIAVADWEMAFTQANWNAVGTLDDQAADIDSIVHCATAGGRRFRFMHDFLIWDLDGGRTPARQRTFERRRSAVLSAGGDFIDLFDEVQQTAGVSWFNDFIHPSAVGQRMIADLLCARLASASPEGGDGNHPRTPLAPTSDQ